MLWPRDVILERWRFLEHVPTEDAHTSVPSWLVGRWSVIGVAVLLKTICLTPKSPSATQVLNLCQ